MADIYVEVGGATIVTVTDAVAVEWIRTEDSVEPVWTGDRVENPNGEAEA